MSTIKEKISKFFKNLRLNWPKYIIRVFIIFSLIHRFLEPFRIIVVKSRIWKAFKWKLTFLKRKIIKLLVKIYNHPNVQKAILTFLQFLKKHPKLGWIYEFFIDLRKFLFPEEGSLSWKRLFDLAFRNLIVGKSRTVVTIGGVVIGVGAICLLVSFAYGLQNIVTSKIIWPEALRVTEVTAESSNLKINQESIDKIKEIKNIEKTAPIVRLAGQITFGGSKTDIVIMGANSDGLKLSNIQLTKGAYFSPEADKKYTLGKTLEQLFSSQKAVEQIAGVKTEIIKNGSEIDGHEVIFKTKNDSYSPFYRSPRITSTLAGFVGGTLTQTYKGILVWGGTYEDLAGYGKTVAPDGQLRGKWVKTKMVVYEKVEGSFYQPKTDENGNEAIEIGYLKIEDIRLLSDLEKEIENILGNDHQSVLGTTSATLRSSTPSATSRTATASSNLSELIDNPQSTEEATVAATILTVWPDSEKQVLISQALLRAWGRKEDEVLGKEVDIQYLVTNSLSPKVSGRLLSEKTTYKIVGVFSETAKPVIYVPLGDVESMGINNYSSLKILTIGEDKMTEVRTVIQSQGFVTRSVSDTLVQINRLFAIIRFLLGSFGAIALIVALFGMFNTLTVSLLERTREIGVMKSLGTTNEDVSRIFLAESVLISGIGGIIGVFFGNFLGLFIDIFVFKFFSKAGQSLFFLPWDFALLIISIAVVVGLITGWYPSRRASKISALNALRYE